MRCLWVFLIFFLVGLSPVNAAGEPIQPELNAPSSLKECTSQWTKTSKALNKTLTTLTKAENELTKYKASKDTWVEKIGFVAVGAGVAYTQFNVLSLLAAGYLVIFQ